jgi:hypothetical protein
MSPGYRDFDPMEPGRFNMPPVNGRLDPWRPTMLRTPSINGGFDGLAPGISGLPAGLSDLDRLVPHPLGMGSMRFAPGSSGIPNGIPHVPSQPETFKGIPNGATGIPNPPPLDDSAIRAIISNPAFSSPRELDPWLSGNKFGPVGGYRPAVSPGVPSWVWSKWVIGVLVLSLLVGTMGGYFSRKHPGA